MASKKSDDPVVKTTSTDTDSGAHPAPAIKDAADSAYDKQYADNPDKPSEKSVAQVEVLPAER
jgi:hypothetical protein